jgi:uncharacterized protein (DUF362 family)
MIKTHKHWFYYSLIIDLNVTIKYEKLKKNHQQETLFQTLKNIKGTHKRRSAGKMSSNENPQWCFTPIVIQHSLLQIGGY